MYTLKPVFIIYLSLSVFAMSPSVTLQFVSEVNCLLACLFDNLLVLF